MCEMLTARKSSGMNDDEEASLVRLLCAAMRRGVGKSHYCPPPHIKVCCALGDWLCSHL